MNYNETALFTKSPTLAFGPFWGSAQKKLSEVPPPALLVRLNNSWGPETVPVVTGNLALRAGLPAIAELIQPESPELSLFWPDMGTPNLGRAFWEKLYSEAPDRTIFACTGGLGRTGTALSIMVGLAKKYGGLVTALDPISYVRWAYDPDAVETQGQIAYAAAMSGVPSPSATAPQLWDGQHWPPLKPGKRARRTSRLRNEP